MSDDYEERARAFYRDGLPDATTAAEYERRLAALLREVAEGEKRRADDDIAACVRGIDAHVTKRVEALTAPLRADLAAERARSRLACQRLIAAVGAIGPESVESAALRVIGRLTAERERCERLRKALLDACDGVDYASHLLEAAGAVVRALDALHPGDLDGGDRG